LVKLFQEGKREVFDLLVVKYQSRIMVVISQFMKKDHSSVEDIAQETFINAYRALDNFRFESQFYTWLYRIAVNSAKNYLKSNAYKSRTNSQTVDIDETTEIATENLEDQPNDLLEYEEMSQELQQVFSQLPREMRDVIVMRELSGKSYQEIAQILDCPIGTVRSRIHRAREKIFELMQFLN